MMTFLAYPKYSNAALVLDRQRLGKQRLEAFQILNINLKLRDNKNLKLPWMNHPACKMWRGFERELCLYGIAICQEWLRRGYKDSMLKKFVELLDQTAYSKFNYPFWLNNEKLYASHRAALLFKNSAWYKIYNWQEQPKIEYFWPKNKD